MDMPATAIDCRRVEEEDLIGRYLRDELPPAEAEAFEMHYFECDRCWPLVQAATGVRAVARADRAASPQLSTVRPFFASPLLKMAATVLLAAGAVLVVSKTGILTNKTQALVRAAGGVSPVPVRLSGDFAVLGPPAVMRGPAVTPSATLRRSADRLIEPDERTPSARTAHEAGAAKLLLGDWNGAIECLRRAEESPSLLADLSAAYLARGIETGSQADIRVALDAAQHSLRSGATPEALFNYAEALDRLEGADRSTRRAAWTAYLAADSGSAWADLARRRLDAVGSDPAPAPSPESRKSELRRIALDGDDSLDRLVAADPQFAREYVEEELIVEALGASSADFEKLREAAARLAAALRLATGNALPGETVDRIRTLTAAGWSSPQRIPLLEAHQAYARGQALYRKRDMSAASIAFADAERSFSRLASPFAAQTAPGRIGCLINQNRLDEAYAAAASARIAEEKAAATSRHPYLAARLDWAMGLVRYFQGYTAETVTSLELAASSFTRMGEAESAAATSSLLAEAYEGAGDYRSAWRIRERVMGELEALRGSAWRARIYSDAASASFADGLHYTARYFVDRQVDFAPASNEPLLLWALALRAVVAEKTGDLDRSQKDLAEAGRLVGRIGDPNLRDRAAAELAMIRARLDGSRSFDERLKDLDDSMTFFRSTGNHLWLADAFEERGKLLLARNEPERAEENWRHGIAELEEIRGRAGSEDFRISRLGTGRRLFDDLISFLMARNRAEEAFDLAEKARARALLDRVSVDADREAPVRKSGEIRALLGPGTVLLSYFALDDRLCIWAISRESFVARATPLSREKVRRLAAIHRQEMRSAFETASEPASSSLYRAMIEPVESLLARASLVVFVPDDVLHEVSFAALGPARGRRVVERWPTLIAPSVSFFVARGTAAAGTPLWTEPSLILAGSSTMVPLESLRGEVTDVSSALPAPVVVEGASLTRDRFLALAPGSGVIHFAGHGVGEESRGPSALVLGPNESLMAGDIQKLDLRSVRLVYLSACSTASGALRPGEGPNSVARAFLASGAPAVVATLWAVDDPSAAAMAVRFYGFYRAGDSPAGALRRAQLELLSSRDTARGSRSWAAFQLFGAAPAPKGG
jgi:CHAT domain-containing protein